MKKILFPILACALGLISASCSQSRLEIPQKGVIPMESFYKTDEDAVSAITSVYHGFATNVASFKRGNIYNSWMFAFNLPGDDVYAACKEYGNNDFQAEINEFRFDSSNEIISNCYALLYLANYYCNLVTDNFGGDKADTPTKKRCVAEARVIRAWIHMTLAIGWGTPPLVDHVLLGSDKPGNYQGTREDLLRWCAKECEEAAPDLYERESTADKDRTVIATKGLAWTVQGKSLLFAGDYAGAKTALRKVIDSGKYALVPGERWDENFHIEGDGNEEKIFETNLIRNTNTSEWDQMAYSTWQHIMMWCWRTDRLAAVPAEVGVGANGWGGLGVREDFAEEFIENDGDSYRRKASIISYDEFLYELEYASDVDENGVPLTLDQKKKDPNRGIKDIRGLYGNGYYLAYKRIASPADVEGHSTWSEANFPIFRYAEVLLMYAECCAMVGDDDGMGLKVLNDIQRRAGAKHISSELTLDEVKREKKFELFTEGCRWADCVRWGDIEGMLTAGDNIPTLYDHFFDAENPTAEHEGYVLHHDYNADKPHGYIKGKHELFPFPDNVTSINPNIVQNPGWNEQ